MAKKTIEERMAEIDARSFQEVEDLSDLQSRLRNLHAHLTDEIQRLAFLSTPEAEIERHKLLGQQDLIMQIIGSK